MAKQPGFTSPYRGVPYVFTSPWKPLVKSLVGRKVGCVALVSSTLTMVLLPRPAFLAARLSAVRTFSSSAVGNHPVRRGRA